MPVYKILTKSGKTLLSRFQGTHKETERWANRHYIKGNFKVKRDKPFEKKWKMR